MSAKIQPQQNTCPACSTVFLTGGVGRPKRGQVFCSTKCRNAAKYNGKPSEARQMSPTEAAYLAGLVDGEGHVSIYGGYGKNDPHAYRVHLSIANTALPLLEWCILATNVGGLTKQGAPGPRQKQVYNWQTGAENAYAVLQQVRPYLVIKAERADLAMEFQERLRVPQYKADRSWQAEWVERIRTMNRRGPLE